MARVLSGPEVITQKYLPFFFPLFRFFHRFLTDTRTSLDCFKENIWHGSLDKLLASFQDPKLLLKNISRSFSHFPAFFIDFQPIPEHRSTVSRKIKTRSYYSKISPLFFLVFCWGPTHHSCQLYVFPLFFIDILVFYAAAHHIASRNATHRATQRNAARAQQHRRVS